MSTMAENLGPTCPVCGVTLPVDTDINRHLDECLSVASLAEATGGGAGAASTPARSRHHSTMDLDSPATAPRQRSHLSRHRGDRGVEEGEEGSAVASSWHEGDGEGPETGTAQGHYSGDSAQGHSRVADGESVARMSRRRSPTLTQSTDSGVPLHHFDGDSAVLPSPTLVPLPSTLEEGTDIGPEGRKRKGKGRAAQSPTASPSKRSKTTAQPSITSFFGGGSSSSQRDGSPASPARLAELVRGRRSPMAAVAAAAADRPRPPAQIASQADTVRSSSQAAFVSGPSTAVKSLLYLHMAETLKAISVIKGRLEITRQLATMLVGILRTSPCAAQTSADGHQETPTLDHRHILAAIYLSSNGVAPEYHGVELGVGGGTVSAAVSEATGRSIKQLRADHATLGDMGDVAQNACKTVRTLFQPKPLTILGLHDTLLRMAGIKGKVRQCEFYRHSPHTLSPRSISSQSSHPPAVSRSACVRDREWKNLKCVIHRRNGGRAGCGN